MYRNVFVLAVLICGTLGEDRWIWSHRHEPYLNEGRSADNHRESFRDREPTTKKPSSGQSQNDDIDDYPDPEQPQVSTPNHAYGTANGFNNGQLFGLNSYRSRSFAGNGVNGILVGPGGPNGLIGPDGYLGRVGMIGRNLPIPQYPPEAGQIGIGTVTLYNSEVNQYPYTEGPYRGHQIVGGFQYPHKPQYTEGYGLTYTNVGSPYHNENGYNPFGGKYANSSSKRNVGIVLKSLKPENMDTSNVISKVNDKVNKDLKKS